MANLKNFGIQGIGSDVQYGKGGARLIANGGVFQFVNAANSAAARAQVATPTQAADATTKQYVDDADAATRTGAGIGSDGSYTANASGFYISTATSLFSADNKLDTAIHNVQLELDLVETSVGLASNGAFVANTGSNYGGNATSIMDYLNKLDTAVYAGSGALQTEVDAIETAVGLAANGTFVAFTGTNYLNNTTSISNALSTLDSSVFTAISTEATTRAAADTAINAAYAAADSAITNAYTAADSAINTAYAAADTAINSAYAAADSAITNAYTAADTAINSAYAAADSAITNAYTAADSAINSAYAAVDTAINTAYQAADTAINTAYQAADTAINSAYAAADSAITNAYTAADSAINAVVAANLANTVLVDGSHAFTANQSMGGFQLTNVGEPTTANAAATKYYVDTKVAVLGNAFNYVGVLANAGVDQANAVDLVASLPVAQQDAGDYFKVTTAGYFKAGANATAQYFNVNDGLVFNTLGGFDKIDNTDSEVAGTTNYIAVSGTVDTGFVVDIDTAFKARVTALETANSAVQGEIDAIETAVGLAANGTYIAFSGSNYMDGATSVTGSLSALDGALKTEATARAAADTAINSAYAAADTAITNAYTAADSAINTAYAAADTAINSAYAAADTAINTAYQAADSAINSAYAAVDTAINAAYAAADTAITNAYTAADTAINAAYAAADSAITNAYTAADSAINTAYAAADSAIQTELNTTQTGAGLAANGVYVANGTANYISGATSLFNADNLLDAQIKTVADSLASLSQDQITSANSTYRVKASNTDVHFYGLVGNTALSSIGSITSGASTNTEFLLDLTTAGEIALSAANSTATNVDLRLAPKGTGQVIIGAASQNGVIQADAGGYSLFLYGGDNTGGSGGDVVLKGGDGSTADGSVKVQDGAGNLILTMATGSASGNFTLAGGSSAVTMSATGSASNLDIVLAPKGTGVVSMSNAVVSYVSTPLVGTDAANKQYVDDQITSRQVGLVKTIYATVTETNGTATLAAAVTGTVLRAKIMVTSAFASGNLVLGHTGSTSSIAGSSDFDETVVGTYVVEGLVDLTGQAVIATVAGSSGSGSAKVVIEYLIG